MTESSELEGEIKRLEADVARANQALANACHDVEDLNEKIKTLIKVLNSALSLTDAMLTELRRLPGPPSVSVIVSKANFDAAMKKLLGADFAATGQKGKDHEQPRASPPKSE